MEAVRASMLPSLPPLLLLLLLLACCCCCPQRGAGCLTAFESNGRHYERCADLPTQGASIAWTLFPHNETLEIAFSGSLTSPSGWIGWGLNPEAPGRMVGTRALIAFRDPEGSATVLPFYIDGAVKSQKVALVSRRTDMDVIGAAVELTPSRASIFATLRIPGSNRSASLNHVWNRGVYVRGYSPTIHGTDPEDLASTETLDMSRVRIPGGSNKKNKKKKYDSYGALRTAHGALNGLSWGFLLPVGVACARYLRPFEAVDPAWFYVHVAVQLTGYAAGATGWALGLRLGRSSAGQHGFHGTLGAVIFALGSLQIVALLFRPKKTHRLRKYWKSYHHFVGYACVVVGVVNVFQGIDLLLRLSPRSYVKLGYSLAMSSLIGVCVVLEVNSWVIFLKRRDREEEEAAAKMAALSAGRRLAKYGNV